MNSTLSVMSSAGITRSGTVHISTNGSMTTAPGSAETVSFGPKLDNQGTATTPGVEVTSRTLAVQGGDAGSITGGFKIDSGATLEVSSFGDNFEAPSIIGADATSTFNAHSGGTVTVGLSDTFTPGALALTDGTATLNPRRLGHQIRGRPRDPAGHGPGHRHGRHGLLDPGAVNVYGGTTTLATTSPVTFGASQLVASGAATTLNLNAPTRLEAGCLSVG